MREDYDMANQPSKSALPSWPELAEEAHQTPIAQATTRLDAYALRRARLNQRRALLGIAMYVCGTIVAYHAFGAAVPPFWLRVWFVSSLLWQALFVVVIAVMMVRQPTAEEADRFWWPLGQSMGGVSVGIAIWAIWLFFPGIDPTMQLVMVIFYIAFVSIAIMTGIQEAQMDRASAVGVFGSLSACFFIYGGRTALIMPIFLSAYAVAMLMLSGNMRRLERETLTAQRRSDDIAAQLAVVLRETVAERDAKTRFLASASHDLTQPLQAARLSFEQSLRAGTSEKRSSAVRRAHWAFDWAEQILTSMIEHLRLESGAATVRSEQVEVGSIIAEVAELNEVAAGTAGMIIAALPSKCTVRADPDFIRRALGNYLSNAIRHSKGKRVLIGARGSGTRVRLWVIDNGRGVALQDIGRLFTDYAQGSDHGNEMRGGFGLGLASVRRMALLMGGDAGFDRRWTGGAAFWLDLPSS